MAAGGYKDTAGGFPSMTLSLVNGKWSRPRQVPLPANAATGAAQISLLYAAACPRTGSCVAVGNYTDSLGHFQAVAFGTRS